MKMSQVEMIVEIANAGSISQAAQNLYVSKRCSGLSRR